MATQKIQVCRHILEALNNFNNEHPGAYSTIDEITKHLPYSYRGKEILTALFYLEDKGFVHLEKSYEIGNQLPTYVEARITANGQDVVDDKSRLDAELPLTVTINQSKHLDIGKIGKGSAVSLEGPAVVGSKITFNEISKAIKKSSLDENAKKEVQSLVTSLQSETSKDTISKSKVRMILSNIKSKAGEVLFEMALRLLVQIIMQQP